MDTARALMRVSRNHLLAIHVLTLAVTSPLSAEEGITGEREATGKKVGASP